MFEFWVGWGCSTTSDEVGVSIGQLIPQVDSYTTTRSLQLSAKRIFESVLMVLKNMLGMGNGPRTVHSKEKT